MSQTSDKKAIDVQDIPGGINNTADLSAVLDGFQALQPDKILDDALRLKMDPEEVEKQLVKLVLVLVELIRRLMESQALSRMERGNLTEDQIDNLGETLYRARETVHDLRRKFGIKLEDFNIDLGPLGPLL